MQLTETFVKQVLPPAPGPGGKGTQTFYRDSILTGFALRVASGGTKSYVLERRIRGKVKRITLGRCEQIGFDKAKSRAIKLIGEIERENAPRILNGKIAPEKITLQNAFSEYLMVRPALNKRTIDDYHRSMRGPLRDWQAIPISELTEEHILTKHQAYDSQGRARYNNALRLLRAILNHARLHLTSENHKAIIKQNPVDVLSRQNLWYPSQQRRTQSHIRPEQIDTWWQTTRKLRKTSTRNYLRFLLLTGLPPAIASLLTFDDIDFENKTMKVKNRHGTLLILPLTNYLIKLIQEQAGKSSRTHGYLFPGRNKDQPVSDPRTSIKRVQDLSGVEFSLNDLHRTFMHLAGESGINPSALDLPAALFKQKHIEMTTEDIDLMRRTQEKVLATVSSLAGTDR